VRILFFKAKEARCALWWLWEHRNPTRQNVITIEKSRRDGDMTMTSITATRKREVRRSDERREARRQQKAAEARRSEETGPEKAEILLLLPCIMTSTPRSIYSRNFTTHTTHGTGACTGVVCLGRCCLRH
jgi:hypothetical protein